MLRLINLYLMNYVFIMYNNASILRWSFHRDLTPSAEFSVFILSLNFILVIQTSYVVSHRQGKDFKRK